MEEWGRHTRCDKLIKKSDGPIEVESMINTMRKYGADGKSLLEVKAEPEHIRGRGPVADR